MSNIDPVFLLSAILQWSSMIFSMLSGVRSILRYLESWSIFNDKDTIDQCLIDIDPSVFAINLAWSIEQDMMHLTTFSMINQMILLKCQINV